PFVRSGFRLGTPAVTTAGMQEPEMAEIATLIGRVLRRPDDATVISGVRDEVVALCSKFTPYPAPWAAAPDAEDDGHRRVRRLPDHRPRGGRRDLRGHVRR